LGRLYLTADVQAFCQDKQIGADALVISEADFLEKMSQKKGMIKSALMDQQFLAGIGNIYSDEILFQSGIHPKKKIDELRKKDLVDLFNTLKKILMEAIEHGANPEKLPGHFIIPHRNEGKKCPSCGGDVKKDKLSGRGFYFCPNCQN
jgi:formamidopyrimidine-DNA glycosylase